jgi:pimeloyl-ACP methyl ester carboxylesterase
MSEQAQTEWSDPYVGQYRDGYVVVPEGIKLHYTEWNPSGEQCVMLIHGLGVQLHTWDPIASLLSRKFRVICPDLRGHGDSEWSRQGYQVERFCEDIHAIAQALNAAPFTWVGHSLGSRIGFAYGGLYPDDVTSLVLCDTAPETPKSAALYASRIVGGSADIKGFNSHTEAAEHFRKIHPEWKQEFYDLHAKYHLRRNWAGKLITKSDPDAYWITRGAGLKEVPFLWTQAGRITKPVLLVWPEQSPFFDDDLISRLTRTILSEVTVARPNTGHYLPRENPELMAEIVTAYVSAATSRGR